CWLVTCLPGVPRKSIRWWRCGTNEARSKELRAKRQGQRAKNKERRTKNEEQRTKNSGRLTHAHALAGLALWLADAGQKSRFHCDCGIDAGPRCGCEHCAV